MNIIELRKVMDNNGAIFSFSGVISQELLVSIVNSVKKELEKTGTENKIINAIFTIAIEQMQNLMSYAKDRNEYARNKFASGGICVIGFDNEKNKYFVASSNKVVPEDMEKIQTKIDTVNELSYDEQRKLIRKMLRSGETKHDRGAGIGFIEMARRGSEALEYKFVKFKDEDYFELKVYV
jgi:hypothetical protein